jgi:MoaD family protein
MAVTVKIPAQLRAVTGGEDELEVEGETVGEALDAVFDAHSDLRERITEDGTLRRFVNVFVSGEDIRFQDGLDTPLADGDEVTILPAVAGGSPRSRLAE